MNILVVLPILALVIPVFSLVPLVKTSTGPILGSEVTPGVLAWKGIPFAVPPIGSRRWMLPSLNNWPDTINTASLGPACIQQFGTGAADNLSQLFYNNPPLVEDEDCLTINIWAPSKTSNKPKAVLFWIYGGGFTTGGSGTFFYDGTSFVENQDIILVSFNYRENVFGFPNSPELPQQQQNLGLFDQHLALSWTKDNIAQFGGDPDKITLFGLSAGGFSVSLFVELFSKNPPFHAAIIHSDVAIGRQSVPFPVGNFSTWDSIASHFACPSANGTTQLDCLRNVSAPDLKQFIVDNDFDFDTQPDGGVTVPDDYNQQVESGAVARVPIMIGDNAQGASFLAIGADNFTAFISEPPLNVLPPAELQALYPVPEKFASDNEAIGALFTDIEYRCPSALFSDIWTNHSFSPVYRFVYGAAFPQFQLYPNAGASEGTELPLIFGNLNGTINTTEITLSKTMQTIWANFAKRPDQPPTPKWSAYTPANKAVAALAFNGNVEMTNVVDLKNSSTFDGACQILDPLGL